MRERLEERNRAIRLIQLLQHQMRIAAAYYRETMATGTDAGEYAFHFCFAVLSLFAIIF